ncbi:MAG: LapA family protein [Gammaproteobacteria bacterium]
MRLVLKLIFLLVLVVPVALAFHVNNDQTVTVDYYLGTVQPPLSVVVAVTLLVGALLGGAMNLWILNRQRRKIAKLKSALKRIERQTAPSAVAVKDAG